MYGHPSGSEHITLRALRGELLLRTSEGDQVHYLPLIHSDFNKTLLFTTGT